MMFFGFLLFVAIILKSIFVSWSTYVALVLVLFVVINHKYYYIFIITTFFLCLTEFALLYFDAGQLRFRQEIVAFFFVTYIGQLVFSYLIYKVAFFVVHGPNQPTNSLNNDHQRIVPDVTSVANDLPERKP